MADAFICDAVRTPIGLQLELAKGVGHMPQYAEPERVAEFIRRVARRAFADTSLAG